MKYLYRFRDEHEKATLGKGTWPYLEKKLSLLIVGDVLVLEGVTKKQLQRVRRAIGSISKGVGARFTWGRYIETPIMERKEGSLGRFRVGSDWQIEGRVTSSVVTTSAADLERELNTVGGTK